MYGLFSQLSTVILELPATFDRQRVQQMSGKLTDISNAGGLMVMVNFTDTRYLDKYGLKALLKLARSMRQQGGKIKLVCVSGQPLDALVASEVDLKIPVIQRQFDMSQG